MQTRETERGRGRPQGGALAEQPVWRRIGCIHGDNGDVGRLRACSHDDARLLDWDAVLDVEVCNLVGMEAGDQEEDGEHDMASVERD